MANRDLLREAIADAKAVKEVAIANAKAALEEAFTPHLRDMLAQKINEMDELEETDLAEVDKEKQEESEMKMKEEGYGKQNKAKKEIKEEELEEELDLEEILAELELEEGEELEEAEEVKESEDQMEEADNPKMEEGEDYMEEDDMTYEAEEEIDLEDMSEDDLKGFIEDVIEDMIEDGELVPGPNADESEAEEGEDTDDGMEGDADVDIEVDDIDLQEGEINEDELEEGEKDAAKKAVEMFKKLPKAVAKAAYDAITFNIPGIAPGMQREEKELKEAKTVIKHLQSELNEVNLLNSKLLYTNKIFKAKNLTENQKIKVLKAFDKAETVKEAKAIFETLNENLVAKTKKSNIRESLGAASKPVGVAPKRNLNEGIVEEDAMVSRFKKLAGIK